MSKSKSEIPGLVLLLMVVVGIYLLYKIVELLVKSFVYLGYNVFFFTDNMLIIPPWGPTVVWGLFGILTGSIIGVGIAIKKYKLSKKLIIYPILVLALFVIIMCFVNQPGHYALASDSIQESTSIEPATAVPVTKYYYKAVLDVSARSGPSLNYPKLFTLKRGATIEVIQRWLIDKRKVEWMKIRYKNQEGYVSSKYVRYLGSSI
jgi:hypothetical protein